MSLDSSTFPNFLLFIQFFTIHLFTKHTIQCELQCIFGICNIFSYNLNILLKKLNKTLKKQANGIGANPW